MKISKQILFSTLSLSLATLLTLPAPSHALTLPDGPDVQLSEAFEGIWVGRLPKSCLNQKRKNSKSRKARKSILKLCVEDNELDTNRELTGSVVQGKSIKVMQDDGKHKQIGKRMTIAASSSLSTSAPSERAMVLVEGKQDRQGLLTFIIADGDFENGDANPGDIVGTFGNCNGVIWRWKKVNPACSLSGDR